MFPRNSDASAMRMIPSVALAVTASALIAAACSVKEDRMSCPCLLVLDFAEVESSFSGVAGLYVSSEEGSVVSDAVGIDDYRDSRYIVSVPRTELDLCLWYGGGDMVDDSGLTIPPGEDCPEVYMHSSTFVASGEMHEEVICLRKNHCRMTIYAEGDVSVPLTMTVEGSVAGYDRRGSPCKGLFEYSLDFADLAEGQVVVLPRQTDPSLMLLIDDGKENVKMFALGHYLESGGYDWTLPDLEDVSITLDFALTHIRISIQGWDDVYTYEIDF